LFDDFDIHVAISAVSELQHQSALQRVAPSPMPAKVETLSSQSVLAEEAELICYELQCFMVRVGSFLVRLEVALGRLPAIITPLAEPHVGPESRGEADLYGCLSPRGSPCTSLMHVVPPAVESEAIIGVMAAISPVLQIMPKLHVLCAEPASPMSTVNQMVDSPEALAAPLPRTPPPLGPSQMLAFVEREGLDDTVAHSIESIGQVVSVGGDVVTSSVVAPILGALFAKNL
jgi:hypothetical protein